MTDNDTTAGWTIPTCETAGCIKQVERLSGRLCFLHKTIERVRFETQDDLDALRDALADASVMTDDERAERQLAIARRGFNLDLAQLGRALDQHRKFGLSEEEILSGLASAHPEVSRALCCRFGGCAHFAAIGADYCEDHIRRGCKAVKRDAEAGAGHATPCGHIPVDGGDYCLRHGGRTPPPGTERRATS